MTDTITIRELKTMPELNATVDLQRAVWGMHDVEVSSPHTLRAIVHSGGAVIGALALGCAGSPGSRSHRPPTQTANTDPQHSHGESEGRLVGFCFGFAAPRNGELWLWSHMAAVHPDFQGRGIGFQLKQAQREWALARGYRWMAWTFDPMQAGNANFNFNRLGVTVRRYSVNHYGDMQDGLNAGLASDRLEAQWELDAPQVLTLADDTHRSCEHGLSGVIKLVYVDEDRAIRRVQPASTGKAVYGIEIPANIAELKQRDIERAKQWQLQLREAMTDLLAKGYVISGFLRAGESGFYLLSLTG